MQFFEDRRCPPHDRRSNVPPFPSAALLPALAIIPKDPIAPWNFSTDANVRGKTCVAISLHPISMLTSPKRVPLRRALAHKVHLLELPPATASFVRPSPFLSSRDAADVTNRGDVCCSRLGDEICGTQASQEFPSTCV